MQLCCQKSNFGILLKLFIFYNTYLRSTIAWTGTCPNLPVGQGPEAVPDTRELTPEKARTRLTLLPPHERSASKVCIWGRAGPRRGRLCYILRPSLPQENQASRVTPQPERR